MQIEQASKLDFRIAALEYVSGQSPVLPEPKLSQ